MRRFYSESNSHSLHFLPFCIFYPPSTPPLPSPQPRHWLTTSLLPLRPAAAASPRPAQPRTEPSLPGGGRPGLPRGRRRRGRAAGAAPGRLPGSRSRCPRSRSTLWSQLHLMVFNEAGRSAGSARSAPGTGKSGKTKRHRPERGGVSSEGHIPRGCGAVEGGVWGSEGKKNPSTEIVNGPWMHWLVLMALVVLMDLLFVGGGELLPCFEF